MKGTTMRTVKTLLFVMFVCVFFPEAAVCGDQPDRSVIESIGVTRGICVVLGDGAAERAVELARGSGLLIYVQLPDSKAVQAACEAADAAGLYGTHIFVAKGPANRLNLADNVANAVVAGTAVDVPEAELLRVLRPQGKALLGGKALVKPVPAGLDD